MPADDIHEKKKHTVDFLDITSMVLRKAFL